MTHIRRGKSSLSLEKGEEAYISNKRETETKRGRQRERGETHDG